MCALLTGVANFCLLGRRGAYVSLTLRERSMATVFRNHWNKGGSNVTVTVPN